MGIGMASGMTVGIWQLPMCYHAPPPSGDLWAHSPRTTLFMSQALWLECPVPARGKKGLLGCRSACLYFCPQPDVTIWGCFQCHGRRGGERLELGNDLWRPLWGEKNTSQGDRSLSLSLSRAPSSHLERVSVSLPHMWPPRCGRQEGRVGEGTFHGFRFVSLSSSTSLSLP